MKKEKEKKKNIRIGSKLYVGFTKKQLKDLLTDKCKKCNHLIDDHRTGDLMDKKIAKQHKKNPVYTCMHCGCKIT